MKQGLLKAKPVVKQTTLSLLEEPYSIIGRMKERNIE
jgi:hypothetical protein